MAVKLRVRRDTAANWNSADPVLDEGEIGYETDTGVLKIGDGVTAWTSLTEYVTPVSGALDDLSDVVVSGAAEFEELRHDGSTFVNALGASYKKVRNTTGATLTRGSLLEIYDATAAFSLVRLADKDTADHVSGVAAENIANNTEGIMQVSGTFENVDTSSVPSSSILYLGDDGAFTNVAPATGAIIRVAKVGVISATGNIVLNTPAFPEQADEVQYDNATSGLTAIHVQEAIDEIVAAEGAASGIATLDANTRVVEPAVRVEEEVAIDTDSTATHAFDLSTGSIFQLTLTAVCALSFTNVPTGGFAITIELIQDATGSRTVTWPASVTWAGGTAPTLTTTANAVDVVTLYTPDGGTTWRGFLAGLDFS